MIKVEILSHLPHLSLTGGHMLSPLPSKSQMRPGSCTSPSFGRISFQNEMVDG